MKDSQTPPSSGFPEAVPTQVTMPSPPEVEAGVRVRVPIKLSAAQRKAAVVLKRHREVAHLKLFDQRFPQQAAVANDTAKLISIFCTRRAAKSHTLGLAMVRECLLTPGASCLYLGLTRRSAHDIIWPKILRGILRKHKIDAVLNKSTLVVHFPEVNGLISTITIAGVDANADEMLKLLGQGYKLACIDEASMYSIDLHNLVYGILKPAMIDGSGQRGRIILAGTASNFPTGLFFDITNKEKDPTTGKLKEGGWSIHEWTAHDNPFAASDWAEELADIAANRPLYMETPQFKQWYLNVWVVDQSKLVYKFDPSRNVFDKLPEHLAPPSIPMSELSNKGWVFLMGIDLGWEDSNAFIVGCYHETQKVLYIIDEYCKPKMTFDKVDDKAAELMKMYNISAVTIDGANKQGVESMRARSNIPYAAVDKQDKVTHIEMFNSDAIQGNIKWGPKANGYRDETMSLVWLTDKRDSNKIALPKKENPTLQNHRCDAGLYMWRMNFSHLGEPYRKKAVIGSREWYTQQGEELREKEYERLIAESQSEWPQTSMDWPEENARWK